MWGFMADGFELNLRPARAVRNLGYTMTRMIGRRDGHANGLASRDLFLKSIVPNVASQHCQTRLELAPVQPADRDANGHDFKIVHSHDPENIANLPGNTRQVDIFNLRRHAKVRFGKVKPLPPSRSGDRIVFRAKSRVIRPDFLRIAHGIGERFLIGDFTNSQPGFPDRRTTHDRFAVFLLGENEITDFPTE